MSEADFPESRNDQTETVEPANPLTRVVKRQRILLWIVVGALVLSLGGLAASLFIKSPAQRLKESAPPSASVITAPVESRVLSAVVTTRGVVQAGALTSVSAPPDTEHPVVTNSKNVGDQVNVGDVLAEVSGRPIIALPGEFAAYRAINPGNTGEDVKQLQKGLAAAGLYSGAADGSFGSGTQDAVAKLFRKAGFEPALTSDDNTGEADSIIGAQQAVTAAKRAVEDAQSIDPVDARAVARAKEDLKTAQGSLAKLKAASGVRVRFGEIVFVPTLPATVASKPSATDLNAGSGGAGTGSNSTEILSIQTGELVVSATLQSGQETGVTPGLGVAVSDEINRRETAGKVVSIGEFKAAATDQATGQAGGKSGYPVVVKPDSPLEPSWLGANVAVKITVSASDAPVLVVPNAAVQTAADGSRFVRIQTGGTTSDVPVTTGIIADGYVEVTPSGGGLNTGDRVVVS
jgi:peptidoglycan hydrolase-like protein with peptidoglycan-binding domain